MTVISTVVDGWWGRIAGLKLRVVDKITAFFRPDGEEKTPKTAKVLLYRRLLAFLWWFRGFKRPEMEDWMRERESLVRGERVWGLATVWTLAWYTSADEGCEPLDRGWIDHSAVIGLICKLIGRSRWAELSGVARCTERLVHRVTWHGTTRSKGRLFKGLRWIWVLI